MVLERGQQKGAISLKWLNLLDGEELLSMSGVEIAGVIGQPNHDIDVLLCLFCSCSYSLSSISILLIV